MRFLAYDLTLDLIRALGQPLVVIRRNNDADLAKQGRKALNSVSLNVAEAGGRTGGDRLYHFRIALGSLREIGAVLDVAAAHGYLPAAPLAAERDRLCGIIFSLQRH